MLTKNCRHLGLKQFETTSPGPQNRYRAEGSLKGKKCARMSADFRRAPMLKATKPEEIL
jgi:hypothetical protein